MHDGDLFALLALAGTGCASKAGWLTRRPDSATCSREMTFAFSSFALCSIAFVIDAPATVVPVLL